jgi:DNA-binding MurR/RpiR family transcriptional regulator
MNRDVRSIGPRIRMMLPSLTGREQQIVDYLLEKGRSIQDLTITEVAHDTEVSEAMLVKLAKKLGYRGFRDLKNMLFRYSQLPVAKMFQELDPHDAPEIILQKVFNTSMHALQETLSILNLEHFKRAVEIILKARQRDFYGLGGSATIAKDASHKFLRIGIRCSAYADAHLMMMSAALLSVQDMVLAVSHSGQTTAVLDAVRLAKQNGATTIGLTNYSTSALATEADIVLCSTARGSPLMGENAAARIAQLNIIDALFVCVAQRDYFRSNINLEKTMSSVVQKREK